MTRILIVLCGVLLFVADPAFAESPPDSDGDGFSDGMETYIGTSPAARCLPYENGQIDAWPPDMNRDNVIDISDVTLELQWFGVDVNRGYTDPSFDYQGPRYDLAPEPQGDGQVDIADVVTVTGLIGKHC